ncbi:hypothetical protein ACFCWG_40970 [Streptomyces sp. NPDC056390]|uniref:hypothetical protein n=1 Tax=Streptomyces sp. NPDC056390 TaxID=3345806 RepID=UPI0035D626DD
MQPYPALRRDLVTDDRRPEDGLLHGEVEDSRILAVLADLAPAERAVAIIYSTQRMTWAQASARATTTIRTRSATGCAVGDVGDAEFLAKSPMLAMQLV